MRILISAMYVSGDPHEGGSGRFVQCLKNAFERMGHTVALSDNPDEHKDRVFDLILCSHFVPKAKGRKIFISQGMIGDEKMRAGADEYVSISEEIYRKNAAEGLHSRVVPQPIDIPDEYRRPTELKKILIIRSYQMEYDPFAFLAKDYDLRYSDMDRPIEEQIDEADLVISLGRGALEAMAYGKPVIVADNRPYIGLFADGYLLGENINKIACCNFSGRYFKFVVNREWIEGEITKYHPSDGEFLREYVEKHHAADKAAKQYLEPVYNFVFGALCNDRKRLRQVLQHSELPANITCHIHDNPEKATSALNQLLDKADDDDADICVLAHIDMHFPRGWIQKATEQIRKLPDDWVLAGLIGKDNDGRFCGHLKDSRIPNYFFTNDVHSFPHEAACMDECCIIVNMKSGFRFDEWLEGFDLYGTLGPCQAKDAGGSVWIIDAFATHYCMRPFTWFPDQAFSDNLERIYKKYSHLDVDTTVLGVEMDENGNVISTIKYRREAEEKKVA